MFHFGPSNYLGDLGGNTGYGKPFFNDNNFKQRNYFYGIGLQRKFRPYIGLQFNLSQGKISGSDQDVQYKSVEDPAYFRFKRNLDFKTKITEGALILSVYPLQFFRSDSKLALIDFQPYFMAGLGLYSFNPMGSYYDPILEDLVWVELQPLRTEGQGMKEYPTRKMYATTQFNMPFGFGLKYKLGKYTQLSFEFLGRKLFTDYLDDVSTHFIDPAYFSTYLNEEDAQIAQSVHNKSNVISPDHPYVAGDIRGNNRHNDFYYSFQLGLHILISKGHSKTSNQKKYFKYNEFEICF
ncbi:MAG: outer membrane beta-barrel protein [Chitinophagaceae bacterium]